MRLSASDRVQKRDNAAAAAAAATAVRLLKRIEGERERGKI